MKNTLFLFTADFPYGTGETFLETEITYLSEGFEKVIIVTQNTKDQKSRPIPANCKIKRIDLTVTGLQKIDALSGLFSKTFWKERKIIKRVYKKKLNKGVLSTMLISLFQAKKVERYASSLYNKNKQNSKLFFYSYWCDDVALGLAMIQKKYPEVNTFSRIHRWDVYFEESAFNYLPYRQYIVENISKIFSISQDGIDDAVRNWKTKNNEKFALSRLGINNSHAFEFIENDTFLIVSCSNLIPVKRVHLIAEALKELKDFNLKWVHFGDGSERKSLENLISALPKNVEVELKGRVPNSEIYNYYAVNRPNLFINVSSSEGVPVSIMEAMSFGIPVIATDVGGNREIVNDKNGRLIDADVLERELAKHLSEILNLNPKEKKDLKANAFETWNLHYNAEKNYTDFVAQIKSI